jgi:hypothetical protein
LSTKQIFLALSAMAAAVFALEHAGAQTNQRCPSLDGAARTECFGRDIKSQPVLAPVIQPPDKRCPSLPEPFRASCFDASNSLTTTSMSQQRDGAAASVPRDERCPSLREPAKAACFAKDAPTAGYATATTTPSLDQVLCPSRPPAERGACFFSDRAKDAGQSVQPATNTTERSIKWTHCPSLPQGERDACFRSGAPTRN